MSELVRVLLDEGGVSGGHLEVGGGAHAPVRLQQLLLRLVQLVLKQKENLIRGTKVLVQKRKGRELNRRNSKFYLGKVHLFRTEND